LWREDPAAFFYFEGLGLISSSSSSSKSIRRSRFLKAPRPFEGGAFFFVSGRVSYYSSSSDDFFFRLFFIFGFSSLLSSSLG